MLVSSGEAVTGSSGGLALLTGTASRGSSGRVQIAAGTSGAAGGVFVDEAEDKREAKFPFAVELQLSVLLAALCLLQVRMLQLRLVP